MERTVERSVSVQRSQLRIAQQRRQIVDAARALIAVNGDNFTTQELAAQAGLALQTFYRYFASKDELLLALVGDTTREACRRWAEEAANLPSPLARLRFYLTATLELLAGDDADAATSRFMISAHWRLHRLFPKELAQAERSFTDLLHAEIEAANTAGSLKSPDSQSDSWLLVQLARSVYHHYAFAPVREGELDATKERLWRFCISALGGTTN